MAHDSAGLPGGDLPQRLFEGRIVRPKSQRMPVGCGRGRPLVESLVEPPQQGPGIPRITPLPGHLPGRQQGLGQSSEVRERLERDPQWASGQGQGHRRFFVTDDPEPFQQVAERFLGRTIRTEACILGSRGGES